jgi:hypothetical protein
MTGKTRYFVVGSGLVMSVGLCTGLVAYYNGNLPLRSSTIGPAELTYVPADTTALAYADVQDIMNSEFRQRLQQALPHGEERDRFKAETGIDVEHDIQSVMAAMIDPSQHTGVVLLRGRFTQSQVEELAKQHGATAEDYRGRHLLIVPADPAASVSTGAQAGPAIAFLEPGLMALGDEMTVRRAIDAADGPNDATANADLMKLVADVEGDGNAWLIGRFDAVTQHTGLSPEITSKLPGVTWLALTAQIDRTVHGQLLAEAKDAESADQLRAVINGALAAAKMVTGQDPKLNSLMGSLQAAGTGTRVDLSFTVPPDVLDMLPVISGRAGTPAPAAPAQ